MKKILVIFTLATFQMSFGQENSNQMSSETTSESTTSADTDPSEQYTFQLSDNVTRKKVTFKK